MTCFVSRPSGITSVSFHSVHLLPYHRVIDPSERWERAAYSLQQRCLVRPCVGFTNSASHPSERWHRGCLAKPWIKYFNCIVAQVWVRWHPSVRWHRGAQKNTRKKILKKPVRTRFHLTHYYGSGLSFLFITSSRQSPAHIMVLDNWQPFNSYFSIPCLHHSQ